MNEKINIDTIVNQVLAAIENTLESKMDNSVNRAIESTLSEVEESIESTIASVLPEALNAYLRDYNFYLKDGTIIRPKQPLRLMGPDKTQVLVCYGGLRVEDTTKWSGNHFPKGWALTVQTNIFSWECIYVYQEKADAISALEKAKKAMDDGEVSLEL